MPLSNRMSNLDTRNGVKQESVMFHQVAKLNTCQAHGTYATDAQRGEVYADMQPDATLHLFIHNRVGNFNFFTTVETPN